MISAIVFDLDGVLVHTDVLHFRAWKALADRLQIPFTEAQGDRCRGVSRMDSLAIVLEQSRHTYTPAEKEAMAEEKNRQYRAFLERMTPADAAQGAARVLRELRRRGYRLAIGSSSKNAPLILEKTALRPLFDAVSDGNCIRRSKPDPEVFLYAAQLLGTAPVHCALVEDAAAGIAAGLAAGMTTVGIGDAARNQGEDYHITSLDELPGLFPDITKGALL